MGKMKMPKKSPYHKLLVQTNDRMYKLPFKSEKDRHMIAEFLNNELNIKAIEVLMPMN